LEQDRAQERLKGFSVGLDSSVPYTKAVIATPKKNLL